MCGTGAKVQEGTKVGTKCYLPESAVRLVDWSVATLFFLSSTMKAVIVRLLCCPRSMDGRVGRTEQE